MLRHADAECSASGHAGHSVDHIYCDAFGSCLYKSYTGFRGRIDEKIQRIAGDVIKTFYFYKKYFNLESQLLLVGDFRGMERYLAALKRLVAELELSDVHFPGRVDFTELLACFQLADAYLSMSEHEGFGVPLIESYYLGVPVVAYAAGAVEETMNGGGILVHEKNFAKTAALLDKLHRDEVIREKIIRSQKKALEKFSRESVSTILLDHIRKVTKK